MDYAAANHLSAHKSSQPGSSYKQFIGRIVKGKGSAFEGTALEGTQESHPVPRQQGFSVPDEGESGDNTDNKKKLPHQGTVEGELEGAPSVDAGKQGKHVEGHKNNQSDKSQWKSGKNGVEETQQGWQKGEELPDGSRVWDTGKAIGKNGETGVRVHIDKNGNIHGYPVDPERYLK